MNKTLRSGVTYLGYPLLVLWPLVVSLSVLKAFPLPADALMGKVEEVALFLFIAIPVVLTLIYLERNMAAQPEQNASTGDVRTDLTHLAMCWFAVTPIAQQLVRLFAFLCAGSLSALIGTQIWPSGWPMPLQLLLALMIGEFGQYWFHRLAHSTVLWRVHATHHGTPQVYWLNSTRFHAFELVLKNLFQVGPLILLGCTRETFLVYGIFTAIHGWVQHSNVAYRTGPINYFMATPGNHRWHHSTILAEANHNYGVVTPLWDHLFGSFYSPRNKLFSGEVGIGDMPRFPTTYLGQFLSPFSWEQLLRTQPTATKPTAATEELEPAREVA